MQNFCHPVVPRVSSLLRVVEDSPVRLLTAKEVAVRLGVCRDSVYRLCQSGELPHVRVLNAIRIAPGDLQAFISRGHPFKRP